MSTLIFTFDGEEGDYMSPGNYEESDYNLDLDSLTIYKVELP